MTTANLGKESFYYPKIIHNNSRNKLIFYTWAFIRGNDNMSSLPSYFSFLLNPIIVIATRVPSMED